MTNMMTIVMDENKVMKERIDTLEIEVRSMKRQTEFENPIGCNSQNVVSDSTRKRMSTRNSKDKNKGETSGKQQ